jgi:hypothetical protein
MRLLTVLALFAFATPAFGADKDSDKAKEVTLAFLKALKAKDLDAVMKTVDVPFLFEDAKEPVTKLDDLKAGWEKFLPKVKPEKIPTEVGMVIGIPAFAKQAATDKEKKFAEYVEQLVGKTGYVAVIKNSAGRSTYILVHMTDGKAKVAGIE